LPGEHAGGVELVEEAVAREVAKDSGAEGGFETTDVVRRQPGGFVERDLAVVGLAEHTVEDDEMVVRLR
jgi:hypothetical protein